MADILLNASDSIFYQEIHPITVTEVGFKKTDCRFLKRQKKWFMNKSGLKKSVSQLMKTPFRLGNTRDILEKKYID